VIGIDPGPTPGLVRLLYMDGTLATVDVVQCSSSLLMTVALALLQDRAVETYLQVERFVIGRASMRSGSAGAITRDQVGRLLEMAASIGNVYPVQRPATEVKAWATDKRLSAAGLITPTKGMTHARDAARHALFCAVADGKIKDPLSMRARRTE
jgi:hypothetical protein